MRALVGLAGLMVAVFIGIYLFTENAATVTRETKDAREQANRWAGQDSDGVRAQDSITLDGINAASGKLGWLEVKTVMADGPMEKAYGLKVGDRIVAIEGAPDMKEMDFREAKEFLLQAYTRSWKVTVLRNEEKIVLPQEGKAKPDDRKITIQKQLEGIQNR